MEFKLFYKKYEYKPTLAAMRKFKDATGLDLWGTCAKYMDTYTNSRNGKDQDSIQEAIYKLSKVLDFVNAAQFLYCLASQSSNVTIEEIEDAMYHSGILPSEREHDMSEPYPFVIYLVCTDIILEHVKLAESKKKPIASSSQAESKE